MNNLSNEDIEFLKNLQHELLTQENDCQADPRFWVVAENKREYGYEQGYEDGEIICDSDGDTWDSIDDLIGYLIESNYIQEKDIDKEHVYCFDEIIELLPEEMQSNYYTCGYKDIDVIAPDTLFITKSTCQNHIVNNKYNYNNPHTYAMTAWRNPEIERLYKILKETNWDNEIPTIDPVAHGEWIIRTDDTTSYQYCSICGFEIPINNNDTEINYYLYRYCPNCGARMDLKENDNAQF